MKLTKIKKIKKEKEKVSLRLICGRAGTGKSQFCLEEIVKKQKEQQKIYMITPEQFSYTAEKKLLDKMPEGASIYAEVLTFKRMAHRMKTKVGGSTKVNLSASGKAILIDRILGEQKKKLRFLGKSDQNIEKVERQLTEFKKHNITIEAIGKVLEKVEEPYLVAKLTDMLLLYQKWEEKIENQYIDENDSLTILAEQLEQTKELCSPYLDYWIERYGLPKDLTYALVSQEYGLLDCTINSSGACGPMQLQVASFHNDNAIEKIKVAVYNNGVPTGEYDEFYVADERKLDDPRLAGQNYLVMQNLEDNFRIGCAQLRRCIDKYKNIFLAIDAYNKGMYAFSSSCDDASLAYYKEHPEDFSWTNIIPNHFGENYGDKDYIWHVLRYLDTDTRGEANIEYNYEGELIKIDLTNTNVYNSELKR